MNDDEFRAALERVDATARALEGIQEFFALLDKIEQSDSGREFHPNQVSSCRVHDQPKIEAALEKMRGVLSPITDDELQAALDYFARLDFAESRTAAYQAVAGDLNRKLHNARHWYCAQFGMPQDGYPWDHPGWAEPPDKRSAGDQIVSWLYEDIRRG